MSVGNQSSEIIQSNKRLLIALDSSRDGCVDENEWLTVYARVLRHSLSAAEKADALKAFHALDTDDTGDLSAEEFRAGRVDKDRNGLATDRNVKYYIQSQNPDSENAIYAAAVKGGALSPAAFQKLWDTDLDLQQKARAANLTELELFEAFGGRWPSKQKKGRRSYGHADGGQSISLKKYPTLERFKKSIPNHHQKDPADLYKTYAANGSIGQDEFHQLFLADVKLREMARFSHVSEATMFEALQKEGMTQHAKGTTLAQFETKIAYRFSPDGIEGRYIRSVKDGALGIREFQSLWGSDENMRWRAHQANLTQRELFEAMGGEWKSSGKITTVTKYKTFEDFKNAIPNKNKEKPADVYKRIAKDGSISAQEANALWQSDVRLREMALKANLSKYQVFDLLKTGNAIKVSAQQQLSDLESIAYYKILLKAVDVEHKDSVSQKIVERDDVIDLQEWLWAAARGTGRALSTTEKNNAENIFKQTDQNCNGKLEYNELVGSGFDWNNNGVIDPAEIAANATMFDGDIGDSKQMLPDCILISVINSYSNNSTAMKILKNGITVNENGDFQVKFPGEQNYKFTISKQKFMQAKGSVGDADVKLLELALINYYQWRPGRKAGGRMFSGTLLTGASNSYYYRHHPSSKQTKLESMIATLHKISDNSPNGLMVRFWAGAEGSGRAVSGFGHEYSLKSIEWNKDHPEKSVVHYINPWDSRIDRTMTIAQLSKVCGSLSWVNEIEIPGYKKAS